MGEQVWIFRMKVNRNTERLRGGSLVWRKFFVHFIRLKYDNNFGHESQFKTSMVVVGEMTLIKKKT